MTIDSVIISLNKVNKLGKSSGGLCSCEEEEVMLVHLITYLTILKRFKLFMNGAVYAMASLM